MRISSFRFLFLQRNGHRSWNGTNENDLRNLCTLRDDGCNGGDFAGIGIFCDAHDRVIDRSLRLKDSLDIYDFPDSDISYDRNAVSVLSDFMGDNAFRSYCLLFGGEEEVSQNRWPQGCVKWIMKIYKTGIARMKIRLLQVSCA